MRDTLTLELQRHVVRYYSETQPDALVCSRSTHIPGDDPNYLDSRATSHSHLILDGRRITPSKSVIKAPNSIIQIDLNGTRYVGQVIEIFSHKQDRVEGISILLYVKWFCRLSDVDTAAWDP